LVISSLILFCLFSCEEPERSAGFEDLDEFSMYDYIVENEDQFSAFLSILEVGELDATLGSYNPKGSDYTLFLPDNQAIDAFIETSNQVSSLDDILNDPPFAAEFCRYHVVNIGVYSGNFPFGAFPEPTLSGDFLTVSFIVDLDQDTSFYKINNQATILKRDIEVSNGYIHLIETALKPVNLTTYDWITLNEGYSIMAGAVELTGFDIELSVDTKESDTLQPVSMLVESDGVYNQMGIYSVEDLIAKISPDDDNYTSDQNMLYNYVGYHIINGAFFLDDFEGEQTNYTTMSDVPLNIDGTKIDFVVNRGKEVFDTVVVEDDTTYIDYIGFMYDESNVLTKTGVIHLIDRVLRQQAPSRATVTFQFLEEPAFNQFRGTEGSFIIDDDIKLSIVDWVGPDLYFVDLGDQESAAWGNDYIEIEGDFEISYQLPRIVQGKYDLLLGVDNFNNRNAMIEVFVDGRKVGGFIDLTSGGSVNNPFRQITVGTVDFKSYTSHKIEIKSLIPGRFLWDYVRFEPA
jgi:uncharacterized surface protein with fasciclin (FAS1) repeats